jgi:hypothetical protein
MRPSTPKGWEAVHTAYRAVKDFALRDQVVAAMRTVGAVLSALREKSKDTPEARTAFDRTCDKTVAYLKQQIEALRFTRAN